MTRRYALSDAHWAGIKDLLPGQAGQRGAMACDNRVFVDVVLYRYRAGIAWLDLPERFGDFRVMHTRHSRWSIPCWTRVKRSSFPRVQRASTSANTTGTCTAGGRSKLTCFRLPDTTPSA